jgi:hypothetical protein
MVALGIAEEGTASTAADGSWSGTATVEFKDLIRREEPRSTHKIDRVSSHNLGHQVIGPQRLWKIQLGHVIGGQAPEGERIGCP